MGSKVFITTPQGCFVINEDNYTIHRIIEKGDTVGFFGICQDRKSGKIIVAGRTNHRSNAPVKISTDTTLYSIDPNTFGYSKIMDVYDVGDVHQIYVYDKYIFLTDTAKNRIKIVDFKNKKPIGRLNIGIIRKDVNHINSIYIDKAKILITLNNAGYATDIFKIETEEILKILMGPEKIRDVRHRILKTNRLYHSHDIQPYNGDFLFSSSCSGYIYSYNLGKPLFITGKGSRESIRNKSLLFKIIYRLGKKTKYKILDPKVFYVPATFRSQTNSRFKSRILFDSYINSLPKIYELIFLRYTGRYHKDYWSRGITISEKGIWVGFSPYAKREHRFSKKNIAKVGLFSHNDFKLIKKIDILSATQVYDLLKV